MMNIGMSVLSSIIWVDVWYLTTYLLGVATKKMQVPRIAHIVAACTTVASLLLLLCVVEIMMHREGRGERGFLFSFHLWFIDVPFMACILASLYWNGIKAPKVHRVLTRMTFPLFLGMNATGLILFYMRTH